MREVPPALPGARGLRRHPALVELSRDHHHALVLARSLRMAAEQSRSHVAREALVFLREQLDPHFAAEEDVLLPRTRHVDEAGAERILREHDEIRDGFRRLEEGDLAGMADLGQLLDDHVRFEERSYFERVQEGLDAAALEALAAAMADVARARGCARR